METDKTKVTRFVTSLGSLQKRSFDIFFFCLFSEVSQFKEKVHVSIIGLLQIKTPTEFGAWKSMSSFKRVC